MYNTEYRSISCSGESMAKPRLCPIGQKYGEWEVVSYGNNRKSYWKCKCSCGNVVEVYAGNIVNHKTKRCRQCADKLNRRENNKAWKGYKEIPGKYFGNIRLYCKRINREFNISIEYLQDLFEKQNRLCAICNIPIFFGINGSGTTASLDRIDSNKGYVEGNVQWVHKTINAMKSDLPQNEFIQWCKLVGEFNG